MPGTSHSTVTVVVSPDRSRAVVTVGGDLDIDARPRLDDAVRFLAVAAPQRIDVDVSGVTYVGSVLPNFLAQVRRAIPGGTVLTVSHPSPWIHFILRATDMATIASIDDPVPA